MKPARLVASIALVCAVASAPMSVRADEAAALGAAHAGAGDAMPTHGTAAAGHGHAEHFTWMTLVLDAVGVDPQVLKQRFEHETFLEKKKFSEEGQLTHVFFAAFAFLVVVGCALAARRRLEADPDAGVLPSRRFNVLFVFEWVVGALWNLMRSTMSVDEARRHFPIVGTLALYIFVMNFMGTIPLGAPATDNLNTNVGMALTVFFATHISGIRAQGIVNYLKHFMGPMLALAPLIVLIEIAGHLVRPVSLSLRLLGNMVGDHKVMEIFLGFHIPLLPLPLMALGLLVVFIQTLVFVLLTTIYIGTAVARHDHGDGGHGAEPGNKRVAHSQG
ncbi:MAG: ATP synthase F0 subunit A [Myxococcales bacterium]|nr:ATP synthase F0 subunit A [Myxococcales bacterium]